MVFETKKISLETLSEYLREVRTQLGFSMEEVAAKIGMKRKNLESLENGSFESLPADVYVAGFLRQLATLYAIDPLPLIEQYKKERAIGRQLGKKTKTEHAASGYPIGTLVITPKSLSLALGGLFVLATIGYVVWQVFSINKTPSLEISEPHDRQLIESSAVSVSGKTDPGISLTINGQSVFVNAAGEFQAKVGLNNGPKALAFEAKNKFGKSATRTVTVIGAIPDVLGARQEGVQLRLEFDGPAAVDVWVDGQPVQNLSFSGGDTKTFTAQEKILISTTDAGATRAWYNEQELGPLGRAGEHLTQVPFFKESGILQATSTPQK